jgi:hypothetical protein
MTRIKTFGKFNEGLIDWLKGKVTTSETPKGRRYSDYYEMLKDLNPGDPAAVVSITKVVATSEHYNQGKDRITKLSKLVIKVIAEGTPESCSAMMTELSKYPWDKSTRVKPQSVGSVMAKTTFTDSPKESDTLDSFATGVALSFCVKNEFLYHNLSSHNLTATLPFIIKYAVKKSIRLTERGFDRLVSFIRQQHPIQYYRILPEPRRSAEFLRVAMYGIFCGFEPHPTLMKYLRKADLSERTGEAFGDPGELFEILKRFMTTHGTPTVFMSVLRRVFPKEYEAEFGKDDIAADMGDIGF